MQFGRPIDDDQLIQGMSADSSTDVYASRCMVPEIYGGYGYTAGPGIERAFRDARLFRLYEGTGQIHQLTIAKSELRPGRSEA